MPVRQGLFSIGGSQLKIEAVLFDMDGVLWDTDAIHREAWRGASSYKEKQAAAYELCAAQNPVMPGAPELIEVLSKDFALGLVSGGAPNRVQLFCDLNSFTECFQCVSMLDGEMHNKPAPDLYRHAAASLNVFPRDCVAVEDSLVGLTAAQGAGMTVIGFGPDKKWLSNRGVGLVVSDLTELRQWFGLYLQQQREKAPGLGTRTRNCSIPSREKRYSLIS